jgi:hypothetical protein
MNSKESTQVRLLAIDLGLRCGFFHASAALFLRSSIEYNHKAWKSK